MAYIIRELKAEDGTPINVVDGDSIAVPLEPGQKYLLSVEVGSMNPGDIAKYIKVVAEAAGKILGKDNVLIGTRRKGVEQIKVYKLEDSGK